MKKLTNPEVLDAEGGRLYVEDKLLNLHKFMGICIYVRFEGGGLRWGP
jgi:hypothetical protein